MSRSNKRVKAGEGNELELLVTCMTIQMCMLAELENIVELLSRMKGAKCSKG